MPVTVFEHSQGLNESSASTETVRVAKSETVWAAKGADDQAARQRIGGQRKIRSAKHREQQRDHRGPCFARGNEDVGRGV